MNNSDAVTIRHIKIEDAPAYLELCRRLDDETSFMLFEPGERKTTVDQMRSRIEGLLAEPNQMTFVAERNGELVGYLHAAGGELRRIAKTAYLVIGIRNAYTGKGIGTALFREMERWAREVGIHRLELTVMTHNAAGVALYKKMGFEVEGVARDKLFVDGRYVDEYMMAKLLQTT